MEGDKRRENDREKGRNARMNERGGRRQTNRKENEVVKNGR